MADKVDELTHLTTMVIVSLRAGGRRDASEVGSRGCPLEQLLVDSSRPRRMRSPFAEEIGELGTGQFPGSCDSGNKPGWGWLDSNQADVGSEFQA